jgi:hypothetical protein
LDNKSNGRKENGRIDYYNQTWTKMVLWEVNWVGDPVWTWVCYRRQSGYLQTQPPMELK